MAERSRPSPVGRIAARPLLAAIAFGALLALAAAPSPPPARAQEDRDLERMQEQIDQVNQDAVEKAAELLAKGGRPGGGDEAAAGLAKMVAKKRAAGDDAFGSPLYWFFMIFVSVVGMGYFASGKRNGDLPFMVAGMILSVYPYFVTNLVAFTLIGIVLTVLPFYLRGR